MKYIHVRNLEKYQDGYKDRKHHWAKVYLDMIQGNPESEMLCEIDFARLVKLIVLETCHQKPTPVSEEYLQRRSFDFGIRSLKSTLSELSHFIDIVEVTEVRGETLRRVDKSREEKSRVERESARFKKPGLEDLKNLFREKGVSPEGAAREAQRFLDHYEANGWRVGRNPMKSVPHAVANWIRNGQTFGTIPGDSERANSMNFNKKQLANMEALSDFTKRAGTARPDDIRQGDGAIIRRFPGD
jgi:hypothetical protein